MARTRRRRLSIYPDRERCRPDARRRRASAPARRAAQGRVGRDLIGRDSVLARMIAHSDRSDRASQFLFGAQAGVPTRTHDALPPCPHIESNLVFVLTADSPRPGGARNSVGLREKPFLSFSRRPEELALMRTIKRAIDPQNWPNPGKVL